MGIINCTPDSFYDGGVASTSEKILQQAEKMIRDGATFLDIGGYSSRPNASAVSEEEELSRILPVVQLLQDHFPNTFLSIDTFRSNVAKKCIEEGAAMINDISAGKLDSQMFSTIASLQVPYCMMHMKGTPQTMQEHTQYKHLVNDIIYYFSERIAMAHSAGINDILVDPGFGFSKTVEQNFELLQHLSSLQMLEKPILTGISRKSMIYKTLKNTPQEALNGTTALHMIALQQNSKILRVHDVKEAKECITLYQQLIN